MTKYTLEQALGAAGETKGLEIGPDIIRHAPRVFQAQFGSARAAIIADANTWQAAGQQVLAAYQAASLPVVDPFIFRSPDLYAEHRFVEELEAALKKHDAIPVAVGSGTINDLTKLASHRSNRRYMSVATAASMDGYTAFGASITVDGSKQTILCPAPLAVMADLDVIAAAPGEMNSWGYADLLAKVTAGADWILADALGVEAIEPVAWDIAQGRLREFVGHPAGARSHTALGLRSLVEGLMLGGFAMQALKSSRAASGAEHQFSHLWDMQHHTHRGQAPSHGFKVGIGTLAVTAFYEELFKLPLDQIDLDKQCDNWPSQDEWTAKVRELIPECEPATVAIQEMRAKAGDAATLRRQLGHLRSIWPNLREKLRRQLLPFGELRQMLHEAGAPVEPGQIGISIQRLRDSFWQAFFLRRRFTVLDLAVRAGVMDICLSRIFGRGGPWPVE